MVTLALSLALISGRDQTSAEFKKLRDEGMRNLYSYSLLTELTQGIGNRISGSPQAAKAVEWGQHTMESLGFEKVRLVPCMVPHWVRGDIGKTEVVGGPELASLALGGSLATPEGGLEAEVIEVHSLDEAKKLGDKAKGKIIFYNGPMDPTLNPGEAYGRAGAQRFRGPATAASLGAVGTLVRSMTMAHDDVPHTGTTVFTEKDTRIPAAAISVLAAEKLSDELKKGPVKVRMNYNCQTMPDEPSASVIGELTGTEHPEEIVVVGGHLDSWDVGQGAHDDGSGVVQSLEALRLIKTVLGKPKRTIRAVLFMNEENGGRGAAAYLEWAKKSGEKAIAGMESDDGGFTPRAFSVSGKESDMGFYRQWLGFLQPNGIERLNAGGEGGADVGPLGEIGAVLIGLEPDNQRYFDFHHTQRDRLENVHPREIQMGANAMATLAWLLSENGVSKK